MTCRERFVNTMNFDAVDKLPVIEWADWWGQTISRWKKEGLPEDMDDAGEIREYLGLDRYIHCGISPFKSTFPSSGEHGRGVITDIESYNKIKEHLYPETPFYTIDKKLAEKWAIEQKQGNMVVWITLEGFFWFPRILLGIEKHLYAFYDSPDLMHIINKDLLKYNLQMIDKFCGVCKPDFMTFAEDMSYNNGPMISKELFDEFIKPYYKKIVPKIKENNIVAFVDTDGNIEDLLPWFLDTGIEGFLPLEKQAGVDIVKLRSIYPNLKLIGGYDKMVMNKNEEEMRAEFERIFPVMRQGGYIPSVDHQTPPGVSFGNYKIYLNLLNEYCLKAGQDK